MARKDGRPENQHTVPKMTALAAKVAWNEVVRQVRAQQLLLGVAFTT